MVLSLLLSNWYILGVTFCLWEYILVLKVFILFMVSLWHNILAQAARPWLNIRQNNFLEDPLEIQKQIFREIFCIFVKVQIYCQILHGPVQKYIFHGCMSANLVVKSNLILVHNLSVTNRIIQCYQFISTQQLLVHLGWA